MDNVSYVYVLVLDGSELLKIGRTDNIASRVRDLSQYYTFDKAESFAIECLSRRDAISLENTLHRTFHFERILLETPGGTEMFKYSVYSDVYALLEIISKRLNVALFHLSLLLSGVPDLSDTEKLFNMYCGALKNRRLLMNISQEKLAKISGVSKRTIERVEHNTGDLGLLNFLRLATSLEITIDGDFLTEHKSQRKRGISNKTPDRV